MRSHLPSEEAIDKVQPLIDVDEAGILDKGIRTAKRTTQLSMDGEALDGELLNERLITRLAENLGKLSLDPGLNAGDTPRCSIRYLHDGGRH